jgi:hypothetical protein
LAYSHFCYCRPPLDALGIAETRAKEYWTKHQAELGQATRYLAIESYPIFSDEIPDLALKLENSPGVNSSDLEEYETDLEVSISCVNIFDTRTQKLVSPEGYAVVDLPARGNSARFGPYTARVYRNRWLGLSKIDTVDTERRFRHCRRSRYWMMPGV